MPRQNPANTECKDKHGQGTSNIAIVPGFTFAAGSKSLTAAHCMMTSWAQMDFQIAY